jgi:hypothetical protein
MKLKKKIKKIKINKNNNKNNKNYSWNKYKLNNTIEVWKVEHGSLGNEREKSKEAKKFNSCRTNTNWNALSIPLVAPPY